MRTLRGLKGRRTLVMVTHRLESTRDCDRIYSIEAGSVTLTEKSRPAAASLVRWPGVETPERRVRAQ